MITLKVPGIETVADVNAMHTVPINHLSRYKNANAPVVVIDTSTGQRWPIWVEIDSTVKPDKANLEIHPSVNFTSGDRYIVALRNLKNAKKEHLQAPEGFRTYRDNLPSSEEKVNERRPHFEEIFSQLQAAGIARSSLYLAWDFTVASDQNNTGRELSMRDAAFSTLGDNNLADGVVEGTSPTFTVTETEKEPNPGEIARRVKGTVVVPCFLFPSCAPGGTMLLNAEGKPIQNGVWPANFDCIVPVSATTGAGESARPSLYGHGLFGDASEVDSGPQRSLSQAHDIVQCATDEIGMSESDIPSVVQALQTLRFVRPSMTCARSAEASASVRIAAVAWPAASTPSWATLLVWAAAWSSRWPTSGSPRSCVPGARRRRRRRRRRLRSPRRRDRPRATRSPSARTRWSGGSSRPTPRRGRPRRSRSCG